MAKMTGSGNFTLQIDNATYSDLMGKMRRLSDIHKEATIAKGLSEGLAVIENEGRRQLRASYINSPRLSGKQKNSKPLINSITRKIFKKEGKGHAGFKRPDGAASHLLDKGTKDRFTKKGYYRGKLRKDLFWTKAFDTKKDKALQTLAQSIELSVNTIVNR